MYLLFVSIILLLHVTYKKYRSLILWYVSTLKNKKIHINKYKNNLT